MQMVQAVEEGPYSYRPFAWQVDFPLVCFGKLAGEHGSEYGGVQRQDPCVAVQPDCGRFALALPLDSGGVAVSVAVSPAAVAALGVGQRFVVVLAVEQEGDVTTRDIVRSSVCRVQAAAGLAKSGAIDDASADSRGGVGVRLGDGRRGGGGSGYGSGGGRVYAGVAVV